MLHQEDHSSDTYAHETDDIDVWLPHPRDCSTLWNMATGTRVWEHHVGFPLWYMSRTRFSRCGKWLCTLIFRHERNAGLDWYAIDIWNASTCSRCRRVAIHRNDIYCVDFSPDAWRLLAVTTCKVMVWNIGHDRRSFTFNDDDSVVPARFSPDGLQLLAIAEHNVLLWSIDDDSLGWCSSQWPVSRACFTPDSKGVLLTCHDGAEEWEVASRECCWKVDGERVTAIAFSSQN